MQNNPLIVQICSHCGQNGFHCRCDSFHPNFNLLSNLDSNQYLILSREECLELMKFFHDDGYISHEFHSKTLKIINRIEEFLK